MSVLYFLLFVGVLVLIHELGHFAAAKLLDVKVLRFSIGYGRPLIRFRLRETEYQLAIFPIGGYTRILGIEEDDGDPRDAGRSFAARPLWQRLVIVFAGPTANLILPIVIYFLFFAGHTVLPAAVIGDVLDGGPAARAGLEPGDKVLEVDGKTMRYWEEFEHEVHHAPGRELHLRVLRAGKVFERYLRPVEELVRRREGQVSLEGRIGVTHAPFIPLVGVIDQRSPAWKAGLRTQDLIVSIGGQPMRNWNDVLSRLGRIAGPGVVYLRGTEVPGVPQVQLLDARHADLTPETIVDPTLKRRTYTGLERAEMFVAHVDAGSPADGAGLRPGDLLTALDDRPVSHWMDLEQRLLAEPTRAFRLTWKRAAADGSVEEHRAELTQVFRQQLDAYGHTVTRLVFGARNDVDRGAGVMIPIEGRMGYAFSKAVSRAGETISTIVSGFIQIIAGDSPREALGGPLMMYRVVSVSGNQGWDSFLLMLALISVNLGLINLLPVPMLDGGHLLIFAVEGLRRRPLSAGQRERVQRVGLGLVVLIMILALRNDVTRDLLR